MFDSNGNSEKINLVNRIFIYGIILYLRETNDWNLAIIRAIHREYADYIEYLQKNI